ncbi:MAG: 3-hydroxyacyl-CoA dehydrogenase [Rhodobacteraceae bacterium]|nr:3-hydroxyacyl-CoA dehydrogenase [Paracoccaceae bacterium]
MTNNQDPIEKFISTSVELSSETPNVKFDGTLIEVEKVGIIGAGTMGGGIAMNFANVGTNVKIVENSPENLKKGLERVRENYQRSVNRGRFSEEELENRMNLIEGVSSLEDLVDCNLIIEAAFEEIEVKKKLFQKIDNIAQPGAILATNTSGLDINEIAQATNRPENVIGLHFFSPANVMKLLEIVQAKKTDAITVRSCMNIAHQIHKIPVLVGVCHGFVGNRILWARTKQAHRLLGEGIMPWDVDGALNKFGFKMGPFQMSDLAGLDLGWSKGSKTQYPVKDALCEMGRRGQKTGKGYYDYDENRVGSPSKETEEVIAKITGAKKGDFSTKEITEILIFPMINEAVKVLEENKAQRPSDIDVIWLFGYGWPKNKGGLMYYADTIGAKSILKSLQKLAEDDHELVVSELLIKMAQNDDKFLDINTGGLIAT